MRAILIVCLFFGMACSCVENRKAGFMPHEEIKTLMKQEFLDFEDSPNNEVEVRSKQLIDPKDFWPEEIKRTLNNAPKFRSSTPQPGRQADLRKFDSEVKKQWNGTCTAFAGVAVMENLGKQKYGKDYDLSERDCWHWYKRYSVKSFIKAMSRYKICAEEYWKQTKIKISDACSKMRFAGLGVTQYIADDIKASLSALDNSKPVYMGLSTPIDMLRGKAVIRVNSRKSNGGHAIAIVGYKTDSGIPGGGYWIVKNSWGDGIGDNGYQYLPFGYCTRSDTYCASWQILDVDFTPSTSKCEKVCRGWWFWRKCRWVCD